MITSLKSPARQINPLPTEFPNLCPLTPADPGPSKDYYLMSDALPEDRQLRQSLQLARLVILLSLPHTSN